MLEGEVTRLRVVPFPGHHTGPRKWLNFVTGLIETGRINLAEAVSKNISLSDKSKVLRVAEDLGEAAYYFLKHIEGAGATQIPHEIVDPFQRSVENLDIKNTKFFRTEHLPNYELVTFYLKNYSTISPCSPSLTTALKDFGSLPVLRVTIPGQAMGMLPHFAIVAHELGHAIQSRITLDLGNYKQEAIDCVARIKARLDAKNAVLDQKTIFRIGAIRQSWINELKADAVGHSVVGPAFFFAFCGFLELSGRNYGVSPSHPPSSLRQSLLIDNLSSGTKSFVDVFRNKTGKSIEKSTNTKHW